MATKKVEVSQNEFGFLVIDPLKTRLKRARDRMQIHNKTKIDLIWTVPPGVFTEVGPFVAGVKAGKPSQDPKALEVTTRVEETYTITLASKRGRRLRRAKDKADPVIIIDL